MENKGKHLTLEERKSIAALHGQGKSPYKIGKILCRASNTIRNELRRGTVSQVVNEYHEINMYFPDTGEMIYRKNRCKSRKIGKRKQCEDFLKFIEREVKEEKRSFAAARAKALKQGNFKKSQVVSVDTLPEKVKRKKKRRKYCRRNKYLKGKSIEERAETINTREEFGHWEIDCVIGKKSGDKVLLTLTERLTRKEIIRRIPKKDIQSVHGALNKLKKEMAEFDQVFKSITSDNGLEFAKLHQWGKQSGVDIYYAHPYSSWERGTNENTNHLIRRFFPKGTEAKRLTKKRIEEIENWINTLYRKVIGWRTSEEYYKEVGIRHTSSELREIMSRRLPEIKRWKQKINTAHIQYELVIRVQEYINCHLFDDLDSEKLSQIVCISKYHFRRLFKAVCGDSLGNYIQRLRLEYIAFKLISTNISVPEILSQINYQNKHTLSRAFKNYFNCSIPEFRKRHSNACSEGKNPIQIEPSIERVPHTRIAYLKLERTHHTSHSFSVLWKQVLQFSESYELLSKGCKYVSLTLDYPFITSEEQSRFMVGVTLPQSFKIPKGFGIYEVPAGEYAIFRFKGLYHGLNRVYRYIYLDWLPANDYSLREPFTFETYINTPEKTPVSELITDIYLPVKKKEI